MKYRKLCPAIGSATLWLALVTASHAANATWTGTTSGTWSTGTNWSATPVPGTGNTATFNAASSNTTIATGTISINTILFDTANAAAYTLQGGTITLNDNGAITVNSSVVNNQLISSNVVLGTSSSSASYSFTNNSITPAQTLTISGNVSSGSGTPNNQTKSLTLNGNGVGVISGIVSGDGSGGGTSKTAVVALTKIGSGSWQLSGANTYTGGTTVTTGSLFANNTTGSATGTGAVSVGSGGTLRGTGTITPTGTNGINVTGVLAPGGEITPGTLTFNLASTTSGVTMNSAASFAYRLGLAGLDIDNVGDSDMLALAGAVAGDFAFNNNAIDFQNTGALGFYKIFDTSSNNANTWTGITVDSAGLITNGLTYTNLGGGYTAKLIMGGNTFGGTSGDIYLQVVPEPSAALLGGLGALLLLRRRRA